MRDWDSLPEHLRESNRNQADDILQKLRAIGCSVREVAGRDVRLMEFSAEEVEVMAELEHDRWNKERLRGGWTLGPRDPERKTSPYLVPWLELPEEVRDWDREAVRPIPELLAGVGLEVRRDGEARR